MNKHIVISIPLAIALLLSSVQTAGAAVQKVEVKLPAFEVSLNSYYPVMQSEAYPPIIYKDVIYVPMTWNNSLRLNIALEWKNSEGLFIRKKEGVEQYPNFNSYPIEAPASENNDLNKSYEANLVSYPITVNGKKIDNAQEPYPILSFRDITYFPLTWRFAHEEFAWTTAWTPEDGFGLIAGGRSYIPSMIVSDNDESLFVSTNIYGTFQINKSLKGAIESLRAQHAEGSYLQTAEKSRIQLVETAPTAKTNQTKLTGGKVMWGDIELMSLQPVLKEANRASDVQSYKEEDIHIQDTVLPLGSSYLISLNTNLPGASSVGFLVNGTQVIQLDVLSLYRWKDNANGSFWVSSADTFSERHHTTWMEHHLWLIDKEGHPHSMNEQVGAEVARILSAMDDGTLIVFTSEGHAEVPVGDIYRIKPDGKAEKMYASVRGNIYADQAGEVFVLSSQENRITKLSDGSSAELSEKMLFLASRGQPQSIDDK
ncbi:hypothetical protein SAMN03159341_11936 [Paenibacillus sp. 1_12]|uniref:hypothetical protein n=1 Tax=Paenibacillus sp. 1_12 TaxID=1566278 RepID=UPI0008E8EBC0|nr:hypothetical protein [Paenibacillus sp. 1_12]SFM17426.1 hypothetical protein SAMN03159341_11936 [Paenibacillus sp. 1_12]